MAETANTAVTQPATSAATAYKLASVFTTKEKPVRPPYEPPDRSWIKAWESEDEEEEVKEKDTTDRISQLPVEIVTMIASHLTPGSLLAFSRVSRFFRSLVFTKRAESIWADARRREGWQDSEAGGLTEVQLANLFDGRDCTVCQGYAYELADLHLRVRLCYQCRSKLRRKGESASTEYWHLHPRAFECCLSTRKQQPGATGELPRGEDSIFFVPDVLKQSAELHKLEAEAVAQNQSPQTVSEAYVVSRSHYRQRAKEDARAWKENRRRLREEELAELELRKSLRRAEISEKLVALGFITTDIDALYTSSIRWCDSCLRRDYDDDVDEWEADREWWILQKHKERPHIDDNQQQPGRSENAPAVQGVQAPVEGVAAQEPSLEQELVKLSRLSHKEKMVIMLSEWHSECVLGPSSLEYFFESDERLTEKEWEKYEAPIVDYLHRRRFDRIWRERITAYDARQKRQEALRPLFGRLQPSKRSASSACASIPISFATFLALPTVETIWYPANAFIDARGWPPLEPQILSEIRTRIRLDKVILFDRIVRAHVADNGVLPLTTTKAIASASSPFVDCDPSKGLAPLQAALIDRDKDPLFAQVASLFRCGICSTKLPYPDIAIHLVDDHDVPSVPAYAHVPSSDFRKAIKSLLVDLGHSSQLELAAFEVFYADCRFDVTMRTRSGKSETSVGETWEQVLSGKSLAELDASRLKLSHSTDRNIVKIKLSTADISDEDA